LDVEERVLIYYLGSPWRVAINMDMGPATTTQATGIVVVLEVCMYVWVRLGDSKVHDDGL
jgi:hypothetical protein